MAPPVLSRIRFGLRVGGLPTQVTSTNPWNDFDTFVGCIEDWTGLLSEGPIGGDVIQQDWVAGAIWQQGPNKTYSFDVPFTANVIDTVNPNIWQSYVGIDNLRTLRGPLLTMRREFVDKTGVLVRREQAAGVLVTDMTVKVGIGRVLSAVAVFQNLSGKWVTPT